MLCGNVQITILFSWQIHKTIISLPHFFERREYKFSKESPGKPLKLLSRIYMLEGGED